MSYGNDYQEQLRPGVLITSKAAPEGGTLGCFARLAADTSKIVMLSASHVLYGDVASMGGSGDGSEVGQPSVSCCLCCTCRVIGKNLKAALNMVTVNVTSPAPVAGTETGTEIDCAIALFNKKRAYTNEGLYGMITGTPGDLGVTAGAAVEMVGSTSGPSKGSVLRFKTVATKVGGGSIPDILLPLELKGSDVDESFAGLPFGSINQMLILPDPDPDDATKVMHFCGYGDSGSVLVNGAHQVVGIVTRGWPIPPSGSVLLNTVLPSPLPPHAGTLGIVGPIGPVLSALGIVIDTPIEGTAVSAAEPEEEVVMQATLRDLEAEVRSYALGAAVMSALDRHRAEVLRLVNTKRQVAVTWRRNGGPAFAAHCLHSIRDHTYVIPTSVDGVTPIQLLERMAATLRRYGSRELRADIDAYEALAYDWASVCTSIWQLVERLRALEHVPTGVLVGVS